MRVSMPRVRVHSLLQYLSICVQTYAYIYASRMRCFLLCSRACSRRRLELQLWACPHQLGALFARLCVSSRARAKGGRRGGRGSAHNGPLQRGAHDGCADCYCIIRIYYRSKYLLYAFTKIIRESVLQFGNAAGTAYHDDPVHRCLS